MLAGQTVLIVESQYLIALDLQDLLEVFQPARTVLAQNVAHAREQGAAWESCALAIIEVERDLPDQIALAAELLRQGIGVIGITADFDLPQSLNWFTGTPILVKPIRSADLIVAIEKVLRREAPQNE